jgi:SAM-dependent methyltransferase
MKYQDFVIKDGKLVGKFEEMYQRVENPWGQDNPEFFALSKSTNAAILNMRKYKIRSVVEVGSGLGYYSNFISQAGIDVMGMELSETAVAKARAKFPEIKFTVDTVNNIKNYTAFDAVLFAEVTWYILPDLKKNFEEMLEHFSGKYFLQNLTFYKGDRQQYGREYFSSIEQFFEFCPFRLLEYTVSTDSDPAGVLGTSSIFKIERK